MNRKSDENRPRIWAEGRQHPPLDARAFALATVGFAREGLSGLLARSAAAARDLGAEIARGAWRIPEDRLGRTGRYLPSHRQVGQTVSSGAGLLEQAARVVRPEPPRAPQSIFAAPAPAPRPPTTPPLPRHAAVARKEAAPGDADLAAIRALMTESAPVRAAPGADPATPTSGAPVPPAGTAAQTGAEIGRPGLVRSLLRDATAQVLGYGLLVAAVPYGAFKAAIAHLNGEDLRKLVD